jgi:hypothetical protein
MDLYDEDLRVQLRQAAIPAAIWFCVVFWTGVIIAFTVQ